MRACLTVAGIIALAAVAGFGASRGNSEGKPDRVEGLIKQLGDDDFARREAASKELKALGKPALPALRRAAASSTDPETRRRARQAVAAIIARLPAPREVHRIDWPGVHVFSTCFSPDGRTLLAGGDSNVLRLYDVKTGKLLHELTGHEHWIGHAIFTPDGKHVLSFSPDRTLRLWDVATGKEVRTLAKHRAGISSVDVAADGKWGLTALGDGSLRIWNFATRKEVRKLADFPGCLGCFSPDGKQVLSGSGGTLRLWDAGTGKELRTFKGHTAPVYGIFVMPDGKQALSYSADQTARVWDLATGKEVRKLDVGPDLSDIRGLALSPDGQRVLVGGRFSNEVRLLELAGGDEVHRFTLAAPPRGLSFSRDGRHAASGTWRGFVYLWSMPDY